MSGCELSLVLPVFGDQKNLNRILAELLANEQEDSWELIVVDDGSIPSLELQENTPKNWLLLRHDIQKGVAAARNLGVRKARGGYVVLLSVFLRIPEDYITQLKIFIRDNTFDFAQHLLVQAPEISANHFQEFLSDQKGRIKNSENNIPIKQSQFAAAIIKKETFCKVKGFDESMQHYGGHEMDLIYRLDLAGFKKRILIEGFPVQRVQLGSHSSIRKRLQEYGHTGLPNLLKKHPALEKIILVRPWTWMLLSSLGLTRLAEKRLSRLIERDKHLAVITYRLYLHLIMRNAWDAR
ncbi:MAG: glycosyltransferase [Candidatus Marinimicrobia bacterium]|nr:glycosyltransferase [Candidatus Neomarinimicrobiota bacterium]